ncbi:MAG: DUF5119 domain-containing protein [Bacteroidota bacterium]|nr:DUF5119 domain-containing protein [Bacteroidota bacterium]
MKLVQIISSLCLGVLLTSCNLIDFSEKCTYHGNVNVRFDWQNLPTGSAVPKQMRTVFLLDGVPQTAYDLLGDTLLSSVKAGKYTVLSYNPAMGITIENNKASLPVYSKDNTTYTTQAPLLYVAKSDVTVQPFETTLCQLSPKCCTQQINIDFVVIKENINCDLIGLTGELEGVSTGYNLYEGTMKKEFASLPFTSLRLQGNTFTTNLKVFGINSTNNAMTVSLQLSDGAIFTQAIDLKDVFKNFTAPAIQLSLEIHLTGLGMTIDLADWHLVNQGYLEL